MNDYKLLCLVNRKKKIDYNAFPHKEHLDSLCSDNDGRLLYESPENQEPFCRITPKGENYIYEEKKKYHMWFTTTVISLLALATAIASVLLQFFA